MESLEGCAARAPRDHARSLQPAGRCRRHRSDQPTRSARVVRSRRRSIGPAWRNFDADFQTGGPAAGWKYTWNPTGSRGNSAAFAPLKWSSSAQAYNTTGGVTPTPGKKTHNDDYLMLTASSGHPGRPNYSPIAGYTIQADDGAGLYRLFDTSIHKADGVLSSNEDGLAVLVYVNNALLGSAQNVSTNGLLAKFDRELGQLNVGDTIWVMIDPLKTQSYDAFANFNFAIQKSVPAMIATATTQAMIAAHERGGRSRTQHVPRSCSPRWPAIG